MKEALEGADVAYVLRLQLERQQENLFPSLREYHEFYGLDDKKLSWAKKDCLVMHPGPMNRGVEISSSVADGPSIRYSRTSHQRNCRANGGALFVGGKHRCNAHRLSSSAFCGKETSMKSVVTWARKQRPQ
jgi:hypothetical protein